MILYRSLSKNTTFRQFQSGQLAIHLLLFINFFHSSTLSIASGILPGATQAVGGILPSATQAVGGSVPGTTQAVGGIFPTGTIAVATSSSSSIIRDLLALGVTIARNNIGAGIITGASRSIFTCPLGQCRSSQGNRSCCSPVFVNGRSLCPRVCP